MKYFLSNLSDCIKKQKILFILLIIFTVCAVVLGVFSAINFDVGVLPIDLSNIVYIKYLKGDCGVGFLIFGSLLTFLIFYFIFVCCCCKKFLVPIAFVFYLYFVYSQIVVFTSIILIYGFFNTIILLFALLFYIVIQFAFYILMILYFTSICNQNNYFNLCFKQNSILTILTICNILFILIFTILLIFLKSFILLLIF